MISYIYRFFGIVHGLFQHCNINLRLGSLNYVFNIAEVHRWHHSKVMAEANNNYGANLLIWDIIIGTRYNPKNRTPSSDIRMWSLNYFPNNYFEQVLTLFRWKKLKNHPKNNSLTENKKKKT